MTDVIYHKIEIEPEVGTQTHLRLHKSGAWYVVAPYTFVHQGRISIERDGDEYYPAVDCAVAFEREDAVAMVRVLISAFDMTTADIHTLYQEPVAATDRPTTDENGDPT